MPHASLEVSRVKERLGHLDLMAVLEDVLERFWSKVNKTDGCWLWTASRKYGRLYGQFTHLNKKLVHISAHRFAWMLMNGPIPDGKWVLHKCDVPHCVNPSHLYLGDRKQNMKDMVDRDRSPYGERCGTAQLNQDQVVQILILNQKGMSQHKLAKHFKISRSAISHIIGGRNWKRVSQGVIYDKS